MITPIRAIEPFDYTFEDDNENPTVWKLRGLDSRQYEQVITNISDGQLDADTGERVLLFGLVGWDNFSVPFSTANFGRIPFLRRQGLINKIMEATDVSSEDKKK